MSRDTDIEVKCPACHGKGHVRKFLMFHWICRICEGTGALNEIDPFLATLRIEGVMRAVVLPPTLVGCLLICAIVVGSVWILEGRMRKIEGGNYVESRVDGGGIRR